MRSIVIGVIERDRKFLIGKRSDSGSYPGLWEFPGGKVESGETQPEAVVRELQEELGLQHVEMLVNMGTCAFEKPAVERPFVATLYVVKTDDMEFDENVHSELRWASLHEITGLPSVPSMEWAITCILRWWQMNNESLTDLVGHHSTGKNTELQLGIGKTILDLDALRGVMEMYLQPKAGPWEDPHARRKKDRTGSKTLSKNHDQRRRNKRRSQRKARKKCRK